MLASLRFGQAARLSALTVAACNGGLMMSRSVFTTPTEESSVQALVKTGMRIIGKKTGAFWKFDVKDITFEVATDFNGTPVPGFVYKGKRLGGHLMKHLTPFCIVEWAHMGPKGDLGTKKYGQYLVEDMRRASMSIRLGSNPRFADEKETLNLDMLSYDKWIRNIEEKMAAHVADNLNKYPAIGKRAAFLKTERATESMTTFEALKYDMLFRKNKLVDENGDPIYKEDVSMYFERRLFFTPKEGSSVPTKFKTDFEEELFESEGLVRFTCPIYDSQRKAIKNEIDPVTQGDIVSCQVSLIPVATDSGHFGLEKIPRSVTILARTMVNPKSDGLNRDWAFRIPGGYRAEEDESDLA